jgi:7-cyano-7-deazaguanine synthase
MSRLILLSGGIDSTAALAQALTESPAVRCLWVDYGQQNGKQERAAAGEIAEHYRTDLHEARVTLPKGFGGSLLGGGGPLQDAATIVPFRNAITLSLAVGLADSLGYSAVVIGSHLSDRATYPDCRTEFTQAMDLAAMLGTTGRIRILQPFATLRKDEVVALGNSLSVPWEKTWSCYAAGDSPCHICGACHERQKAFGHVALAAEREAKEAKRIAVAV